MKIEIGESLIYSWFRHCQNCSIVQTNWKSSPRWNADKEDIDNAQKLMDSMVDKFGNIFNKTVHVEQLMKQAEIDVIGIDPFSGVVHAADIAFHGGGLGYPNSVDRVAKKMLRTFIICKVYFKSISEFNLYFLTPKSSNQLSDRLHAKFDEIRSFVDSVCIQDGDSTHYSFDFFVNETFKSKVVDPVMDISSDIADTTELFLRAYRLLNINNVVLAEQTIPSEVPIGKFVQNRFQHLLSNNLLSDKLLNNLQDTEYSRDILGINYPILIKIDRNIPQQRYINGYPRYYTGEYPGEYYLCNHWYERNRQPLITWLAENGLDY